MITLGKHSYIAGDPPNKFRTVVTVGNYTSIGENLVLLGGQAQHPWVNNHKAVSNFPFKEFYGLQYSPCLGPNEITIGSDVWIGDNVTLMGGITIGHGAIIGASCVVTKSVPPFAVMVGNPGVIKKYRFPEEQIKQLLSLAWWDLPEDDVRLLVPLMTDIETFLTLHRAVLDNKL